MALEKARARRKEIAEKDPSFNSKLASALGKRWISNDELEISKLTINPGDYVSIGWYLGRKYKNNRSKIIRVQDLKTDSPTFTLDL